MLLGTGILEATGESLSSTQSVLAVERLGGLNISWRRMNRNIHYAKRVPVGTVLHMLEKLKGGEMNTEALKALARPLGFVLCTLTICILAVAVSAGWADPPAWVFGILMASWEWPIERAWTKRKETKTEVTE